MKRCCTAVTMRGKASGSRSVTATVRSLSNTGRKKNRKSSGCSISICSTGFKIAGVPSCGSTPPVSRRVVHRIHGMDTGYPENETRPRAETVCLLCASMPVLETHFLRKLMTFAQFLTVACSKLHRRSSSPPHTWGIRSMRSRHGPGLTVHPHIRGEYF